LHLALARLAPLVYHERLREAHLVEDVPHGEDRDEERRREHRVGDDLGLCVLRALRGVRVYQHPNKNSGDKTHRIARLEDDAEVDGDELLGEGEDGGDGEDEDVHAAGGEDGGGDCAAGRQRKVKSRGETHSGLGWR
jgi:hypothetical protein